MNYYIVPEEAFERLEKARKDLAEITQGSENTFFLCQTEFVRRPMFELTHRKYPKAFLPKLFLKLARMGLWGKR